MVSAKFLVVALLCCFGELARADSDLTREGQLYHYQQSYGGKHSHHRDGYNRWITVNGVKLRLTDRPLSWNNTLLECERLGGVLFDAGDSNNLLFDVADRLYGDGQQIWINMQYIDDGQTVNGMKGPGWYWLNSRKRSPYQVFRQSRYCTSAALTKVGKSVLLWGDRSSVKNIGLCMIVDRGTVTIPVTVPTPVTATTPTTPSSSTPCATRRISAVIPANQNAVQVEVVPGVTLTFSAPGTFEYKQNGCSVIVDVTKNTNTGQPFVCSNSPVTLLTTPGTNTAPFSLLVNGSLQTIQLPAGKYTYTIQTANGPCQLELQVLDGTVLRRLDVVARYSVPCVNVNTQTQPILELFAKKTYGQLNSITNGKVQEPSQYSVTSSCSNNLLTVRWPTSTTYPASVTSIPTQLNADLQNAFKLNPNAFQLVLSNNIPPVINPLLDIQNLPATPTLESLCSGSKIYNPTTDSCS